MYYGQEYNNQDFALIRKRIMHKNYYMSEFHSTVLKLLTPFRNHLLAVLFVQGVINHQKDRKQSDKAIQQWQEPRNLQRWKYRSNLLSF